MSSMIIARNLSFLTSILTRVAITSLRIGTFIRTAARNLWRTLC